MADGIRLAIVGATGAVGREMLKVLEERNFKIKQLTCLADPREAGTKIEFRGETLTVAATSAEAFQNSDLALFAGQQ
jgi:aspartate-semialdehyde dehydrogenase